VRLPLFNMKWLVIIGAAVRPCWSVAAKWPAQVRPLPEAFVMKSWSSLKETMNTLGNQVSEILEVRQDLRSIKSDLATQEAVWQEAENQLKLKTDALKTQNAQLQVEVQKGSALPYDLMKIKEQVRAETLRRQALSNEAAHVQQLMITEKASYEARKASLLDLITKERNRTDQEAAKAHEQQLQLQSDAGTLRLKISELQDKLKTQNDELDVKKQKHAQQVNELKKQLDSMYASLAGIHKTLEPYGKGAAEQEQFRMMKAQLQEKLKQETATIIQLQLQHQQDVAKCGEELQAREEVRADEEQKVQTRTADAEQFCNHIQLENLALTQRLGECRQQVGSAG